MHGYSNVSTYPRIYIRFIHLIVACSSAQLSVHDQLLTSNASHQPPMRRLIPTTTLLSLLRPLRNSITTTTLPIRFLTTTPPLHKTLPPLAPINDADITENFLKGSGPGGQKINKTSSAVQLLHHPTGIVVKCQETRSRSQNRKIARKLLALRLEELELGSEARTQLRAAVKQKRKSSKEKKARRKYRKLAEEKEGIVAEEEGEVEGEEDVEGSGAEQNEHGADREQEELKKS